MLNNDTTYPQVIGTREDQGRAIAEKDRQMRINDQSYKRKSQSSDILYDIILTEIGWKCTCPDHQIRGVKCKHIFAVEFVFNLREQVKKNVSIEPVVISDCPFCHSTDIKKFGIRHNKSGDIQRFVCGVCDKTFSINIGFEKMKHNPQAITTAMQLYFSGESLRNTKNSLKLIGVHVSHQTVLNWTGKYTQLMKQYVDKLKPKYWMYGERMKCLSNLAVI